MLSAALLIAPYCRKGLWLTAWFGFVPLFFALQGKTRKQAFFLAYLAGIVFWVGTIYWLVHITLPGTIILILYLALYFSLFGFAFPYLLSTDYYLLSIPSAWVVLEYARSHLLTGFPWALLGYSQYRNLPAIQIADVFGVWGVSFLVMMVNALIFKAVGARSLALGKRNQSTVPLLLIIFTLVYGYYKLHPTPNTEHPTPIKVSVIQGNIPQELKWRQESEDYIFDRYIELNKESQKENPDLIIWPEASLPVALEDDITYFDVLCNKIKESRVPLLFGAVTQRDGLYYNSALLIETDGRLVARYDKVHLVPFGEYIPLKNVFPFLQTVVPIGDIEAGKEYTIFEVKSQRSKVKDKVGVLICFEDLFPEISREYARHGAHLLVNITNDAWYKYTSAPYQHLQASVFRAVENRLPLARSANTGISCFIGADGKIESILRNSLGEDIFVRGLLTRDIPAVKAGNTIYTCFGDFVPAICLAIFIYGIIRKLLKKK